MNNNSNLSKDTINVLYQTLLNKDDNFNNNNYIEKFLSIDFFPRNFSIIPSNNNCNLSSQNKDRNISISPFTYDNVTNINKNICKPENIIDISQILIGKEKRTFVRLHPIPKKYSVFDMVRVIDKYLKTEPGKRIYNAVYLPMTKIIGKNMGYLFINLISPKYVIEFYKIFNGFSFGLKKCKKPCSVVFSDNQEIDISNEDPTRRPLIFLDTIKE